MSKHSPKDILPLLQNNWLYLLVLIGLIVSVFGVQYVMQQNQRLFQETQALQDERTILTAGYTRTYIE